MAPKSRLTLWIVPILVFMAGLAMTDLRGPYFLGSRADPEYHYLFNYLNIARAKGPGHMDHPGTTLQELGGLTIRAQHAVECAFSSCPSLVDSVLKAPESYLRSVHWALMFLIATGLGWSALQIFSLTGSLLSAFVFQLSFLFFFEFWFSISRVCPEPLLIVAGLGLFGVLVNELYPEKRRISRDHLPWITGFFLGLGIVTKATFLPVFLSIFLIDGKRRRWIALGTSTLTAIFFLIPALPQYHHLFGWFFNLMIHTGRYGSGEKGLPHLHDYIAALKQVYGYVPFLFFTVPLSGAAYLIFRKTKPSWSLSAGVIAGIALLQILITAKHVGSQYLLPALLAVPVFHLMAIESLRGKWRALFFIYLAVGFSICGVENFRFIAREKIYVAETQALNSVVAQMDCTVVTYYRSSSLMFAFAMGNSFGRYNYTAAMTAIYPDAIFYDIFEKHFTGFGGREKLDSKVQDLLDKKKCVLLFGDKQDEKTVYGLGGLVLEPVKEGQTEAVYRLLAIQPKQTPDG